MKEVGRETVNTNPEPRVKPHLPSIFGKESLATPRAHNIASQYQNNKSKVFNLGYFEHTDKP